jgi:hypothetical protein
MPGRGIRQNLRNLEAISLRPEPLAMVNAEISLGTKRLCGADTVRPFVNRGFGQKSSWRECLLLHKADLLNASANVRFQRMADLASRPPTRFRGPWPNLILL